MIAVIPARQGSKSVPGKNRRVIAGRSLVGWVIAAALEAATVDRVIVTTDDPAVEEIAVAMGADLHHRSAESATDSAPTENVLREVLEAVGPEDFVLLQATSPLTTAADIDRAVGLFDEGGFDSVVSAAPQRRFLWERQAGGEGRPVNYDPRSRPRRQEMEPILVENGAVYVSSADLLEREGSRLGGRIGILEMAPETYFELDEPEDWDVVASLLRGRGPLPPSAQVRIVFSDVDGVLTDNGMYWGSDGTELKRFSARDGKGFQLLHEAGVKTALLTSEGQDLVTRRGEKLGCHAVVLNCSDKVAAAEQILDELGLDWSEAAFIGDDVHDLGLLAAVGTSFSPGDAITAVRFAVGHVLDRTGGAGCFREAADLIIAHNESLARA
jgi:YrbI family 3-deoxy-D-manno-octulosonate 8-phosphate phosphatase